MTVNCLIKHVIQDESMDNPGLSNRKMEFIREFDHSEDGIYKTTASLYYCELTADDTFKNLPWYKKSSDKYSRFEFW